MNPRRHAAFGSLVALGLALSACSSLEPRTEYTSAESVAAEVPEMGAVRFYADGPASAFNRFRRDVYVQAAARHEPVTFLALSSGGSDGAFGAGFLKGLAATNRRPQFTMVSGVSTGALMAPFAFLGPAYDATLEDLYTSGFAATLVKDASLVNGLFGNALVDTDRLGRLIGRYIDQNILDAVAAEHRKGRRLLVVTTNLDAQRSVIWDMGAIASSRSPAALPLFRQVLAASASIPGLFPPRLIQVEAGGRRFQEMHVDGGTVRQIYVAPDEIIFGSGRTGSESEPKQLYVLMNNKIDPSFQVVENSAVAVAARSLATVLKRQGRNNVLSSYGYATSHGIGYHLAFVGADAPDSPVGDEASQFSTGYMREVFARGESQGRSASPWASRPPMVQDPGSADLTASR